MDFQTDTSDIDTPSLADYAQQAYLEYALSVVKGRALPHLSDGQKPVQRRILYAMERMGLSGAKTPAAKPVKSARVVGDVLGRFHPHGDQAAYEALVRMAQDFHQRYPLIEGQGNFGSRDGDGAAAMRYTEARLAPIAELLLGEIDQGTVDFIPNYDGSAQEPEQLPARLPFVLLNGASGIAVGLATEIPSHNLKEVAAACVAVIKNPKLSDEALLSIVPGPDYPGGGQIISSAAEIAAIYAQGRGSLKVRARAHVEELARGQWQWVIDELPPGVSSQKILEEIEELTNPKVRVGKKALTAEQLQLKQTVLGVLDAVRDESSKDASVRLVFEPKTSKIELETFTATLLTHTSLEASSSVNLTMVGTDGTPTQKTWREILQEWIEFRQTTIYRRTTHRLEQVQKRIHILEGRILVLLNIDEVIALIRESDEPKAALIARFGLTEVQAEDILEIRLRQLARLEAIRIEKELSELRAEAESLAEVLDKPEALKRLMIKEIEQDAKRYGDERRTLIEADSKSVVQLTVNDEPVTVVVSQKGWVRARTGHGHDAAGFQFKAGDALYRTFECRTVDSLLAFASNGRVYSLAVAALPGARGDGQPITSFIELEAGTQITHYLAGPNDAVVLLANSGGYGFLAQVQHMTSRIKAGKSFMQCQEQETLCTPMLVPEEAQKIACVSQLGRVLCFAQSELRLMPKGGRGLLLMSLDAKDSLLAAVPFGAGVLLQGEGRGGKVREESLTAKVLQAAQGPRARKGKAMELGFKLKTVGAYPY